MLSRRRLLRSGLYTTARHYVQQRACQFLVKRWPALALPSSGAGFRLTRYVDPLPIPPAIRHADNPEQVVEMEMVQFQQKVHRDLPATTGGDTTVPGLAPQSRPKAASHSTSTGPANSRLHIFFLLITRSTVQNQPFLRFATSLTSMAPALCRMTTATLRHGSPHTASTARSLTLGHPPTQTANLPPRCGITITH